MNSVKQYAVHITKMPDDSIHTPHLFPKARELATDFGHLLARPESLTLDAMADRIIEVYNHPRIQIQAGEAKRWMELMRYAEDHIVNFSALPIEFEYMDGLYEYDDILKILGDEAIDHLFSDQAA